MLGFLVGLERLAAFLFHVEKFRRKHDYPAREFTALGAGAGLGMILHGGQLAEHTMSFAFVFIDRHVAIEM